MVTPYIVSVWLELKPAQGTEPRMPANRRPFGEIAVAMSLAARWGKLSVSDTAAAAV